jgi:SAM-dependent methyltransferase
MTDARTDLSCWPQIGAVPPAMAPQHPSDIAAARRDYSDLDSFLNALSHEVYPEAPCEVHSVITGNVVAMLRDKGLIAAGMHVLDVGCGQGVALELFQEMGMEVTGITLGTDCNVCRAKNFDVHQMDQSFMDFPAGKFDFLWCRHVLEHSFAPLFTLTEYRRVTKPSGLVYIEVPAPDTYAHHETNPNHYSVLPFSSWGNLYTKAGFNVMTAWKLCFGTPHGVDTYYCALMRPA